MDTEKKFDVRGWRENRDDWKFIDIAQVPEEWKQSILLASRQTTWDKNLRAFREKHLPGYVAALLTAFGTNQAPSVVTHVLADENVKATFVTIYGERPE